MDLLNTSELNKEERAKLKEELLKQLEEEKEFNDWAVKVCRDARKG